MSEHPVRSEASSTAPATILRLTHVLIGGTASTPHRVRGRLSPEHTLLSLRHGMEVPLRQLEHVSDRAALDGSAAAAHFGAQHLGMVLGEEEIDVVRRQRVA